MPCLGTLLPEELREHRFQVLFRDADAGVFDVDSHPLAVVPGAHGDTAAVAVVLYRVAYEVGKDEVKVAGREQHRG